MNPDYVALLEKNGITDPDEQKKVLDFLWELSSIAVDVAMKKDKVTEVGAEITNGIIKAAK